jgi:hypothetical protein
MGLGGVSNVDLALVSRTQVGVTGSDGFQSRMTGVAGTP